jgi:hypothetical protein
MHADLVLANARFSTPNRANPNPEAVAIADRRIAAVGGRARRSSMLPLLTIEAILLAGVALGALGGAFGYAHYGFAALTLQVLAVGLLALEAPRMTPQTT